MTQGTDPSTWPSPDERARVQWLLEQELRAELLASSPEDRDAVTHDVYNRLFEQVPWHDAHGGESVDADEERLWLALHGFLCRPTDTLVDLGCGSGGLVSSFAGIVAECIGIDTSDAMIELAEKNKPANARFLVGNLIRPPLPDASADIVVTRQVMEHLHPDDIPAHLASVLRILRPGGRFLIETPSRLTGPWDASRKFTPEATGFHLHEYTNAELASVLRSAGFERIRTPGVPSRVMLRMGGAIGRSYVPVQGKVVLERLLAPLPTRYRRAAAGPLVVRDVTLVAHRPR